MLASRLLRSRRIGMTLLELVATVTLMGVFAVVAVPRLGRAILGDNGSKNAARQFFGALHQAQRATILTGLPHRVTLSGPSNAITHWQIERNVVPVQLVGEMTPVPDDCVIATTADNCQFQFDGTANQSITVTFTGANRSYQVHVYSLTGMIDCREIP